MGPSCTPSSQSCANSPVGRASSLPEQGRSGRREWLLSLPSKPGAGNSEEQEGSMRGFWERQGSASKEQLRRRSWAAGLQQDLACSWLALLPKFVCCLWQHYLMAVLISLLRPNSIPCVDSKALCPAFYWLCPACYCAVESGNYTVSVLCRCSQ